MISFCHMMSWLLSDTVVATNSDYSWRSQQRIMGQISGETEVIVVGVICMDKVSLFCHSLEFLY